MRNEYETWLGDQLAALSAVSQRIKSLETRVGQVLAVREKPCVATPAGVPLLRRAAQTAMLEYEALTEMGGGGLAARTQIAIVVNADSTSTRFTAVLERLPDVLFDIRIENHSARLLRPRRGSGSTDRPAVAPRTHDGSVRLRAIVFTESTLRVLRNDRRPWDVVLPEIAGEAWRGTD